LQKKYTEHKTAELKLRVPARTRREIEAQAKRNERSVNAEVLERLERSLSGLAEEVLMGAYGPPPSAQGLIEAYRRGMLRLREEDRTHIKKWLNDWADQFFNALKG
jgi:Arc-like DNA binding dprotein